MKTCPSCLLVSLLTAFLLAQAAAAGDRSYRDEDMHDQAIQESLIPVRPGIPGQRPFWNENSRRFVYVPAFDFKVVDGAKSYLLTAYTKTEYRFESPSPTALLTPVWLQIPIGTVELKCEALDAPGGKVIGLAGTRKFEKGAVHFNSGIWDMHCLKDGQVRTTPEQYEKNLRQLLSMLKATGAKLIWATTTPVGPVPAGASNIPVNVEDVPAYNAIAARVMQENNVAIDDLYSAVLPKADELRGPDNRHYTPVRAASSWLPAWWRASRAL